MKQWNLIVDVSLCTNCNNCVIATQDEYLNNDHPGYAKKAAPEIKTINIERHIRAAESMFDVSYVPAMCQHCDDAPCIQAAGDGSVYQREDGIVMFDPDKTRGRRDLVDACPLGAVVWNEDENVPQNWNFDAHLLDAGWVEPRCVQACPTQALAVIKATDEEMRTVTAAQGLQPLHPEKAGPAHVHYKNLQRAKTHFIGGTVTAIVAGEIENVPGASVNLLRAGEGVATCETDDFGNFKFDNIHPGTEGYSVRASSEILGIDATDLPGAILDSKTVELTLKP